MKRILHISDLHFGRIHPPAIEALESFLAAQQQKLDLIVMTGDWTQRARKGQYQAAAEFIKRSPFPVLTIPGNHDIPLYNFVARLLQPLRNYNRFIRSVTTDIFEDPEMVIVGFRTASVFRPVEGRILKKDIERAESTFSKAPDSALRVIACHHPLFQPKDLARIQPEYLAKRVLALKPHLVLSGHSHLNWVATVKDEEGHQILHVSAGSATSDRLRGEVNSFHIITTENAGVNIETYFLSEEGFVIPKGEVHKSVKWEPFINL
ncbi:metallophosphoesterase [Bdellovibrio bacteriovorus]|uniref:metallophosphoesterase family protein n=1 Tax=Bdellovibrio bacteriovorus TaxID=959 RepID=UPI0035A71B22